MGITPSGHAWGSWTRNVAGTRVEVNSRTLLVGILSLAAALRFALLGHHGLTSDEIFAYWITRNPWAALPHALAVADAHPPLFYAVMKAWIAVAGSAEAATRLPSACFGVGIVALTYALARRVAPSGALLAAFLVAVSPFQVMASQEVRMYALFGLLVLGSTVALAAAAEHEDWWRWAGYAAIAALMVYTHNFGFLILLAHGVWLALYARRRIRPWLAAIAATIVVYLPWVPYLAAQAARPHGVPLYTVGTLKFAEVVGIMGAAVFGLLGFGGSAFGMQPYMPPGAVTHWVGPLTQAAVVAPFLALAAAGAVALRRDRSSLGLVLLPPAIVFTTSMVLLALTDGIFPRIFSFLVPFYALLVAEGIIGLSRRWRDPVRAGAIATVLVVAVGGATLMRYYLEDEFWPYRWREVAALVSANAAPTDFFIFVGRPAQYSLSFYYREAHASLMTIGPDFTAETAKTIAAAHPRAWLIVTTPYTPQNPALLPRVGGSFRLLGGEGFGGIWVYLLQAR